MDKKLFRRLEIAGVFFTFFFAVFLHFIYDLTNGSIVSIIFGSVNESIWEHMKIYGISYVIWAVVELLVIKPKFKQFVVSKMIALTFLLLAIPLFYYGYTFFTKEPILFVDIGTSIVWVIISFFISYRLVLSDKDLSGFYHISLLVLLLYIVMFFSFSVFPPKLELFRDTVTGMYGIIPQNIDSGAISLDLIYKNV